MPIAFLLHGGANNFERMCFCVEYPAVGLSRSTILHLHRTLLVLLRSQRKPFSSHEMRRTNLKVNQINIFHHFGEHETLLLIQLVSTAWQIDIADGTKA